MEISGSEHLYPHHTEEAYWQNYNKGNNVCIVNFQISGQTNSDIAVVYDNPRIKCYRLSK